MDLSYSRGEFVKVELNDDDLDAIRSRGFCVDRRGFAGMDSKTWIFIERNLRTAHAHIDAGGDLSVHVPASAQWEATVAPENITSQNEGDTERYLGKAGIILVSWPGKE